MVTPSQKGKAKLRVKDKWLVGVNEWGINPSKLTDNRITKREKIGAAHGALCRPAARSIIVGSCVAKVCHVK